MGFRDRLKQRLNSESSNDRPPPIPGAMNYILLILDSCRYDAFAKANMPILKPFGEVERRYAYATWTAPSHYNLLMGLLPHPSPQHVFASTYYKKDLYYTKYRTIFFVLCKSGQNTKNVPFPTEIYF